MEPRVPEHLAGTILPIKVTWLRFRSRQVMGWRLVDVRYWHKADMTAAFVNVRFQDKRGTSCGFATGQEKYRTRT